MLIVGERINSTKKEVQEAIRTRNATFILKEADRQIRAGAQFVDVNCAVTMGDEVQDIDWVISVIQSEIKDVNICVDSPNYLAIDRALNTYKGKGRLMINSITGDESRMKYILPLAIRHDTKLIALTMNESGMPNTAEERFAIARNIFDRVRKGGFNTESLYFDPLIRPVSTETNQAKEVLRAIPMIKSLGNAKTVCGLSNISYGLPNRSLINSIFLTMAMETGLDAAILDPLDKNIISHLKASTTLLGMDEFCADYIKAFREGILTK